MNPYLRGSCSTIRTDRDALSCIIKFMSFTGQRAQSHSTLFEMNYDVVSRVEIKFHTAKALSHLNTVGKDKSLPGEGLPR